MEALHVSALMTEMSGHLDGYEAQRQVVTCHDDEREGIVGISCMCVFVMKCTQSDKNSVNCDTTHILCCSSVLQAVLGKAASRLPAAHGDLWLPHSAGQPCLDIIVTPRPAAKRCVNGRKHTRR